MVPEPYKAPEMTPNGFNNTPVLFFLTFPFNLPVVFKFLQLRRTQNSNNSSKIKAVLFPAYFIATQNNILNFLWDEGEDGACEIK